MRSFRLWAWVNALIWVFSFLGLSLWLKIFCGDQDPMSPNFCGLTAEAVSNIQRAFFEIYFPYLGFILTSAITAQIKLRVGAKSSNMDGIFIFIVLVLSLFFNGFIILSFRNFLPHPSSEYQVFLENLRSFSVYMAIIVAAALSFFYNLGWFASSQAACSNKTS